MTRRPFIFNPYVVLTIAIVSALMFALFALWRYEGEWRDLLVFYFAPIGVPFIAFLFDRAEHWREVNRFMDIPIVALALLRSAYPIPLISGHSLFLTYALLTGRSWVARLTALLILAQVITLKTFVWHDSTLLGGIVLGGVAAWLNHWWRKRRLKVTDPQTP